MEKVENGRENSTTYLEGTPNVSTDYWQLISAFLFHVYIFYDKASWVLCRILMGWIQTQMINQNPSFVYQKQNSFHSNVEKEFVLVLNK